LDVLCLLLYGVQGAFYVLPDMSSFFGPGVEMDGFGPVPDCDALAMYLIKVGAQGLGSREAEGRGRYLPAMLNTVGDTHWAGFGGGGGNHLLAPILL
jgi:hypothetical protein